MKVRQYLVLVGVLAAICAPASWWGAYQGVTSFEQSRALADPPAGDGSYPVFTGVDSTQAGSDPGGGICPSGTLLRLCGSITGPTNFGGAANLNAGGALAGTFSGSPTLSGTLTYSSTSPLAFNAGGTSCPTSGACSQTLAYTTGGVLTWTANAPSGSSRIIVDAPNSGTDACIGGGSIFEVSRAGSDNLKVLCAGGINVANGSMVISGTGNHLTEGNAGAMVGTIALTSGSPSTATLNLPSQFKGTTHPICQFQPEGATAAIAAAGVAVSWSGSSGAWVAKLTGPNSVTTTMDWGPCVEVP